MPGTWGSPISRWRHGTAFQIEAAERLGIPVGTDGLYDVVVEAAGTVESLARAIDLVGPRGTVVVLGVHVGSVDVNWSPLFHREARLLPSLGYCAHDGRREMEDAAAMLAADPEIARTVITHRFPIEDAVEAFRVAGDRSAALDPSRDRTVKPCDGGQLTRCTSSRASMIDCSLASTGPASWSSVNT